MRYEHACGNRCSSFDHNYLTSRWEWPHNYMTTMWGVSQLVDHYHSGTMFRCLTIIWPLCEAQRRGWPHWPQLWRRWTLSGKFGLAPSLQIWNIRQISDKYQTNIRQIWSIMKIQVPLLTDWLTDSASSACKNEKKKTGKCGVVVVRVVCKVAPPVSLNIPGVCIFCNLVCNHTDFLEVEKKL